MTLWVKLTLQQPTGMKARNIPVPKSRNINDVSDLYPLQQSLGIGTYVKILVHEVLLDHIYNNTRLIPAPRNRNINDVSGLYPLSKVPLLIKGIGPKGH